MSDIRPFIVPVASRDVLDDLRRRTVATRSPDKETVADDARCVPIVADVTLAGDP